MPARQTRVLVVWEEGAGLGPLVRLSRIAQALARRRKDSDSAASSIAICGAYLCRLGNSAALAPYVNGPIRLAPTFYRPGTASRPAVATYADVLGDIGYASAERLSRQIGLWRRIYREDRPDLVLVESSPTALIAARSMQIATVATGSPFHLPPADLPEFPLLPPGNRPRFHSEPELRATLNGVLEGFDSEGVGALPQIFDADATCVTSLPLLDPYDGKRSLPILPPIVQAAPAAQPGDEVIVWLAAPAAMDEALWEALTSLALPVRVLADDLDETIRAKLERSHISFGSALDALIEPSDLIARGRVLVSDGSSDLVALGLGAGLPQLCLPLNAEQATNGYLLLKQRAAVVLNRGERTAASIALGIRQLYEGQAATQRARTLASTIATRFPTDAAEAIVDLIEAVGEWQAEAVAPSSEAAQETRDEAQAATAPPLLAASRLQFYRVQPDAPEVRPGRAARAWMNATSERYAYRCLPLTIANSSGWEFLLPASFEASWDGGIAKDSIKLKSLTGELVDGHIASSHFGHGILTFHMGYILRTDPGWGILCRGAPNQAKDGIAPLDGLIETDWLPFTFTMNWRFTRPCTVRFNKDEAFCFVMPVAHLALDAMKPEFLYLDDAPELKREYTAWSESRATFLQNLEAREPQAVREAWQRFYLQGKGPTGEPAPASHRTKRNLPSGD